MFSTMKKRALGFTIVELMVAVAVMAILVAIAAPNFSDMLKANRVQSISRDLYSQLNYARSEAVSRRKTIMFCHSSNGTSCGGTWSNGWVICLANSTTAPTDCGTSLTKYLLRVYKDVGNNTLSVVDNAGTPVAQDYFYFSSSGVVTGSASSGMSFTAKICESTNTAKYARAILITPAGQILDSSQDTSTGIYQDAKQGDLVCP